MQNEHTNKQHTPTVSRILNDGRMVELVYTKEGTTSLAVWDGNSVTYHTSIPQENGEILIPVKGSNNLIRHGAVLLPARAETYESVELLIARIRTYLDRYIDLSESFRAAAPIYVLFSWVYDAFNEVPYLRFRGDFGTGKTRALQVLGSILYKPFFASGASTLSPLFHTLDLFKGTLIFDETDFRYSDERSDIVKVFNNGTSRGLPVLRTMVSKDKEFNPRAFSVFGPKIVGMRRNFRDEALESRFLTEDMGQSPLRTDIPISLPHTYKTEACSLRNMLLMYRFQHQKNIVAQITRDTTLSPRASQLLQPLLALAPDDETRTCLIALARDTDARIRALRSETHEALLLPILLSYMKTSHELSIQTLTDELTKKHSDTISRPITARYVGSLMRTRLYLHTYKHHGVFVIPFTEQVKEQIRGLCSRYGLTDKMEDTCCGVG